MSLSNPNKPVTEQRLSEFYQGILPYLGGMPEMLANKFSKGDLYSTDEKMIGQWIDGKPLYQKTVSGTFTAQSQTAQISTGVSNIDFLMISSGAIVSSDYIWELNEYPGNDTDKARTIYVKSNNSFEVLNGSSYPTSGSVIYITFQYTKTTDSAIEIGSDTDYSTTEKIVGTWIDGKPIYQRTFDLSSHANWSPNSNVATGINIPNIEQLVYLTGSAQYIGDDNWFMIPHTATGNVSTSQSACFVLHSNGDVYFVTGTSLTFKNLKFTIQYTKTTD